MKSYSGTNANDYAKASQTRFEGSSFYYWESWQMNGYDGNDTLIGGEVNDTLSGGNHNDSLEGLGGDDTIYGGDGSDILNGGTGVDKMYGGAGNDTYYVDTWGEFFKDSVIEYANQGTDTVFLSAYPDGRADFYLYENVENVTLTGNAFKAYGNDLDNVMTGNSLNNIFYGKAGNDTLYGEAGNDRLEGDAGTDILYGGAGNDTLNGYSYGSSTQYDTLVGDGGADTFVLGNKSGAFYIFGTNTNDGYAKIKDFNWQDGDKIQVHGGIGDYSLNKTADLIGGNGLDTAISYKGDIVGIVADTTNVFLGTDFTFVI